MGNFEITDNFYLDGKPFQIIRVQFIISESFRNTGRTDLKN